MQLKIPPMLDYQKEVAMYHDWYSIAGVFLDEMSCDQSAEMGWSHGSSLNDYRKLNTSLESAQWMQIREWMRMSSKSCARTYSFMGKAIPWVKPKLVGEKHFSRQLADDNVKQNKTCRWTVE